MPKTKTHKGTKKRFSVTGAGTIMRRRRHRTTPPGHLVKSSPGKRKRGQQDTPVAPSDRKALKKLLGI
jgi:large subunit ribosomal protein L35